jgi:hypothetical protein
MSQAPVNPASDSALTVRTINSDGTAPKLRVATPAAAYSAYVTQRDLNGTRDKRFAAIAGIEAGFPPTSPSTMERMGMGDMPNMNSKQFRAKSDAYCSNWNAINAAGSDWFEVEAEHDNPMEAMRRSKCLTEKFNRAIKRWDSTDFCCANQYIIQSAVRDKQMAMFDLGIAYFADGIDFRWRCIPTRKVLVPEGTKVTLENCPVLFFEDQMSVPDLYSMRKKPGWNEETILSLLYMRTNQTSTVGGLQETYAAWVERIRENDDWMFSDFPPLNFVHIYVKEFTDNINKGKISHGIFCPDITFPSGKETKTATVKTEKDLANDRASGAWMYHKDKVAERWSQVLIAFVDNPGPEGTWHGCKGYGDLIFDGCHLGNVLLNRTYSGAMIKNSLIFQTPNEGDRQKIQQMKWTPFGIMNPGLQLEQLKFEIDVSAGFEAFNLNTNILNQNSRNFPQNDRTSGGEQPTATQTNFDRADQAQFTGLQVSNYRSTGLDCLGSEMYRRLAQPASKYPESWPGGNVAKEFRDACKEYGIPESDLLKVKYVRASRNVGTGNKGLDVMVADQLLTIATPGDGQKNAQMYKAVALVGPDLAPAFVQTETPEATTEDWQINQENLNIQAGQTPQAFGYQEHMKHLGPGAPWGHLTILQGLQQLATQLMETGIPPQEKAIEEAVKIHGKIESGIQHSGQHVDFLAQYRRNGKNPALHESDVKELRKVLNDFVQFNETFGESIQSAQEQVQPDPSQQDPKMLETQAKIERDNMLAQNKAEIAKFNAQNKAQNTQLTGGAKLQMSAEAHQQKLGQQAESATVEIEKKQVTDAMDVEKKAVTDGLDIMKSEAEARRKMNEAQNQTNQ